MNKREREFRISTLIIAAGGAVVFIANLIPNQEFRSSIAITGMAIAAIGAVSVLYA